MTTLCRFSDLDKLEILPPRIFRKPLASYPVVIKLAGQPLSDHSFLHFARNESYSLSYVIFPSAGTYQSSITTHNSFDRGLGR